MTQGFGGVEMRRARQRKGLLLRPQISKAGQSIPSSKDLEVLNANSVLKMFDKDKQDFTQATKSLCKRDRHFPRTNFMLGLCLLRDLSTQRTPECVAEMLEASSLTLLEGLNISGNKK